jgi:hypothetical protein
VTPRALTPQTQVFLAVHAIEAVLADIPTFSSQQYVDATIAESKARKSELGHALAQFGQWIHAAAVEIHRTVQLHAAAGLPIAPTASAHQVVEHFAPLDAL